jgi:hypothetical protein
MADFQTVFISGAIPDARDFLRRVSAIILSYHSSFERRDSAENSIPGKWSPSNFRQGLFIDRTQAHAPMARSARSYWIT